VQLTEVHADWSAADWSAADWSAADWSAADWSAADYRNIEFMTYSKPSSTEELSNDNWIVNMKINTKNDGQVMQMNQLDATMIYCFFKCDIPVVFYKFNMYSVQLVVKTQLIYCAVCTMYKNYMFRPILAIFRFSV